MIVLDDKIVGIWFIGMDNSDFMAGVRELIPNEKYELKYRFRYHKDDKVFESDDVKNWYRGTLSGTRNYVMLSMHAVTQELTKASGGKVYELLNDQGMDVFMREFRKAPFMYERMATPEERDEVLEKEKKKNG